MLMKIYKYHYININIRYNFELCIIKNQLCKYWHLPKYKISNNIYPLIHDSRRFLMSISETTSELCIKFNSYHSSAYEIIDCLLHQNILLRGMQWLLRRYTKTDSAARNYFFHGWLSYHKVHDTNDLTTSTIDLLGKSVGRSGKLVVWIYEERIELNIWVVYLPPRRIFETSR